MAEKKLCKKCFGTSVVKCGFSKSNYQIYQCTYCNHRFTDTGLKIGRPKTNFECATCGEDADLKGLCQRCYARHSLAKRRLNAE
jgi:glutathione peroxidase-family protein